MKNIERAKGYQKNLYEALGKNWEESHFRDYWEGGIYGNEWDYLYDHGFLENDFCAWCGNSELKSDYYRSPSFSKRGVRVPICDECFIKATGGNVQFQSTPTKSGCFIATAVLGNPLHPDVLLLKNFRDDYLFKIFIGRFFIQIYYLLSPPIAKIISRSFFLRWLVRKYFINPITNKVREKYYNT